MIGQFIRLELVTGNVAEGILNNWCEVDESDNTYWLTIITKGTHNKVIKINRKHIVQFQMEEIESSIHTKKENRINIHANKIPFQTSSFEKLLLNDIVLFMQNNKNKFEIDDEFIIKAENLAMIDQGVFDLMKLFSTYRTNKEVEILLAEIAKSINDYEKTNVEPEMMSNISLIEKIKQIAEQKRAKELSLKQEISEQYAENVYSSPISILKK